MGKLSWRTVTLTLSALILALFAASPAGIATASAPDKLLIYPDVDTPGARNAYGRLLAELRRQGLFDKFRLKVEFLPVDVTDDERLPMQLKAALARRPDAIVGTSSTTALALKALTSDIPIVFNSNSDPVSLHLVSSYARPGGNLTGITRYAPANGKRLELLKTAFPRVRSVGVLADKYWLDFHFPDSDLEAAAQLGLELTVFRFSDVESLEAQLASPEARRMDAWFVPHTFTGDNHQNALFDHVQALRKPVIFGQTRYVRKGGLMAYEQVLVDARYAWAKRLKAIWEGATPGDIPVERPIQFELSVNANAARAYGLEKSVLKRADAIF